MSSMLSHESSIYGQELVICTLLSYIISYGLIPMALVCLSLERLAYQQCLLLYRILIHTDINTF